MNILKRHILVCMLVLFATMPAMAQVEVKQTIDSLQLLIGEQTALHLQVRARQGQKVVMPSYKPTEMITPGIEVVEQQDGDTSHIDDNNIVVSRHYILTSFDENVYAIPALNVKVDGKDYHGNPLALKVLTVAVDTVHTNQFYPPKDVQDNPFQWSEWSVFFWLSVLVVLLCTAFFYLRMCLKNNKPIKISFRVVKRVPAHEKALNEINEIKQQSANFGQETQKEYYTRLTNTLREYIESRFGFNAMEMTSGEIIENLSASGDQKMIDELRGLFRTADLVKFAKYETLINENDANLVNAINFIDQTKTDEVAVEEKVAPTLSDEDKKTRQQRKLIKVLMWLSALAGIGLLAYVCYGVFTLMY